MTKAKFESPITEKWFGRANRYEPKSDTDYEWVWEYAKFRLAWATERCQHMESKALEFVKLVIGSAAAGWAVLTVLGIKPTGISSRIGWFFGLSLLFFLASLIYTLRAYLPTKRLLPVAEDAALRCADSYKESSEAMAKFSQTLSSATEYETEIAANKAGQLWLATLFLSVAVILFLSALFLGAVR